MRILTVVAAWASLALAGCATPSPSPCPRTIVPADLADCAAVPVPGALVDTADLERLTVETLAALRDCRDRLGRLVGLVEGAP